MVDDSSSATIATARVGAQERIRAAALDSEGDSQHKVLLRIRAPPNVRVVASVRVVAPTALVDEPPRLLAEGTKRLDREAPIQVAQRLLFDHLLVAGALGLAILHAVQVAGVCRWGGRVQRRSYNKARSPSLVREIPIVS